MSTSRRTSLIERSKIYRLIKVENKLPPEVSVEMNLSVKTVKKWAERIDSTDNNFDLPRSGRPKVLSPFEEAKLVNYFYENPFNTMLDCIESENLDCCEQTGFNYLKKNGIQNFCA